MPTGSVRKNVITQSCYVCVNGFGVGKLSLTIASVKRSKHNNGPGKLLTISVSRKHDHISLLAS